MVWIHSSYYEPNGRIVYSVQKISDDTAFSSRLALTNQGMGRLAVVMSTPIPPEGRGLATQDWPTQCLHDYANDDAWTGADVVEVGPVSDSWGVVAGGVGFSRVADDSGLDSDRPQYYDDRYRAIWIAPKIGNTASTKYTGIIGGATVGPGQNLPLSSAYRTGDFEFDASARTVTAKRSGLCFFSAGCTISSTTASNGDVLRMRLYQGDDARYLHAYRLQCIEWSGTTVSPTLFYTGENVAFQGPLNIEKGDVISVRNDTSLTYIVGGFIFSATFTG